MGEERWRQLRDLFDAVCDLPPETWDEELARRTRDPALIRETLGLLRSQTVALERARAPLDGLLARIRELAAEHKVPIFEAPPLARALYYTTDLEREIPAGLYLACAQVLAYIFQLRTAGLHGQWPQRPQPEVPQELVEYLRKRGKPV